MTMGDVQTLINRMVYWCRDANMGYSQYDRWNFNAAAGNCDCSSLVIHCLQEAGFDTGSASYTGNMSAQLTARGWQRLPVDGNPQPGDILLNDVCHTAVYIGNGLLAQASISEYNTISGNPGDQTGQETNISGYYEYPWDCYLRYREENMALTDADVDKIFYRLMGGEASNGNRQPYGNLWETVKRMGSDHRWLMPQYIGAKGDDARFLFWPGVGVIPLYDVQEMSEITADLKNTCGYTIPTIMFASVRQRDRFLAIVRNEDETTRRQYLD